MSKKIRNLLSEIDKKFKDSEEGIQIIDTLQSKLENAPTQNQKEKFESEMKKEIKKLQRLRDFFRTNQNNPDIKDKSKLDQGRKMIENEMERFREHEKEFKMKQYSKRALMADYERKDNFVRGDSDGSHSYGNSDDYGSQSGGEGYGSDLDDDEDHEDHEDVDSKDEDFTEMDNDGNDDPEQLAKDKEWLDTFIADKLKKQITQVELEVDNIRNKKIRGALKKQKDMLKTLNDKLKLMRSTREKCEELAMTMEFLEGGAIKSLKSHLKKYHDDVDNETFRNNVDKLVQSLIDLADKNRKNEDVLGGLVDGNEEEEEKKQEPSSDSAKYGHLGWLHDMIDLSLPENSNIILTKAIEDVQKLKVGQIIDAQDYLGSWHLSVVCKVQLNNEQENIKLNFLPYPKGNRDEWISKSEAERVSGPFVNSTEKKEADHIIKSLASLNNYIQTKCMPQQAGSQKQAKQQKAQPVKAVAKTPVPIVAPTPAPVKKEEKPKPTPPKEEIKKEEEAPKQPAKQPVAQQRKGKAAQNSKGANKKLDTSKVSDEVPVKVVEKPQEPQKELGIAASVLGQDAVGQIGGANIIGSTGLFQGPNPFSVVQGKSGSGADPIKQGSSIFSASDSNSSFDPMGVAALALGANSSDRVTSAQDSQEEGPPLNFKHNQVDLQNGAMINDMFASSFKNIPLMQDQDFLCPQFDIKCPLPVDDSVLMAENDAKKQQIKQDQAGYRYFPTSAMFNRQSNFQRIDLESLFYAFYYQQGTYQQYLASLELKKRGWEFHIRFQTWIKKEVTQEYSRGGKQQTKSKTIYFDFENEWKIKTNTTFDISFDDPKHAMQIENELINPTLPPNIAQSPPNEIWIEAMNYLNQEQLEKQFSIGEIRTSQLPKQVLDQLCS